MPLEDHFDPRVRSVKIAMIAILMQQIGFDFPFREAFSALFAGDMNHPLLVQLRVNGQLPVLLEILEIASD